jgi:citrate lyase gamma subunit
VKIGLNMGSSL